MVVLNYIDLNFSKISFIFSLQKTGPFFANGDQDLSRVEGDRGEPYQLPPPPLAPEGARSVCKLASQIGRDGDTR